MPATIPLTCNATFIQFVGQPTEWVNINLVTGKPVSQGFLNPADYVNAIGYNILDNFLYGYDLTVNQIVRIDAGGNLTMLGLPTGLTATTNGYNTGCFDDRGYFYLYFSQIARMYVVDLRPGSASYMRLVDPTNGYAVQTSSYGVALVNGTPNIADWVWLPSTATTGSNTNGFLYGIVNGGAMARVNIDNAHVINMTTTGPAYASSYGAMSVDVDLNVYAVANENGNVYRYTINGTTATGLYFSNTYFDSHNDGAMCRIAKVLVDFGDAPDTGIGNGAGNYSTLLAKNGPRHQVIDGLMLGTTITAEDDAYQNTTATGDDLLQGIQDDGLATPLPILSPSATSYQLNVTATNNLAAPANLYAWVDFNQNGLFEVTESTVITVPANSGTATYPLDFTVPSGTKLTAGNTFVRLRLTTDTLTQASDSLGQDNASLGPAGDGEVEDYLLQISPLADLQVTKIADVDAIQVADEITYTITITNNGPDTATSPLLVDAIPAELKSPTYSIDNGITWQDVQLGSMTLPDLTVGSSFNVLVKGIVVKSATGQIENIATVTATTPDPDMSNNTATVTTTITPTADVGIVKINTPPNVAPGDTLTYNLIISNAGPVDATNTTITDVETKALLNPEFSFDGFTWSPWSGNINYGTLVAGTSTTVYLRGTVDATGASSLINVASITSDILDPNPDNNTSSATTTITDVPIPTEADLDIEKSLIVPDLVPGTNASYQLVVTNHGPSAAENIVLIDPLPNGFVSPQYSIDNGTTWQAWTGSLSLDTMAADEVKTVLIDALLSPATLDAITNTATVYASTPDPDMTNNTSTTETAIDRQATINITKTASPNPVNVGNDLTYTVYVQNEGPSYAQHVVVKDVVPTAVTNPVFSTDGISWSPWTGAYTIDSLPSGGARTLLIRGTVSSSDDEVLTNSASVTSDITPETRATTDTRVRNQADLGIVKWTTTNSVVVGDTLAFTLTVTNNGPSPATDVLVTDPVPSGLADVTYSLDQLDWQPWDGSYLLGTLNNGDVAVVYLRGVVKAAAANQLINTAVVTSSTDDPNLNNNSNSFEVNVQQSADLAITKIADKATLASGDTVTYTLAVTNNGPSDVATATLADEIPIGLTAVEFSTNGTDWQPWVSPYQITALASGETTSIQIRGTVTSDAINFISNLATISSSIPDPNPTNNTAVNTVPVPIVCPECPDPPTPDPTGADLSITKTTNKSHAHRCKHIQYIIAVTNNGPEIADAVVLIDEVTDLLKPMYSINRGRSWLPWQDKLALGDMPANQIKIIHIAGKISNWAECPLTNTATVYSQTTDPNPINNSATVKTRLC
ncbi:MAG: DUF11 domain-containing protein [Turicibacter sp.]|nr:DUF11 domain-containing protein [Turicibacter sp.]